ncbi:hypothetical protein, conserved [Eimeria maxima]|uniref:Myb-like domain-containing protein n=1 Tax=Eimeria maxima TaxID=5804 RepID=U6LZG5_EIMMA|nr:hypothetical protein, conserved [Eimeria maxima]CDJ56248.1 hypothetical protein, conserved [Eimeria maxima]
MYEKHQVKYLHATAAAAAAPTGAGAGAVGAADWMAIEGLTNAQRRLIIRHIRISFSALRLFNHGLWPENSYDDYMQRFQAPPLKREGMPWTEEEDKQLLELAEKYDVNFGDPWLYLSWEMQRESEDVHSRYLANVTVPQHGHATVHVDRSAPNPNAA